MWTLPPLESVPFSKDVVKSAKLTAVHTAVCPHCCLAGKTVL